MILGSGEGEGTLLVILGSGEGGGTLFVILGSGEGEGTLLVILGSGEGEGTLFVILGWGRDTVPCWWSWGQPRRAPAPWRPWCVRTAPQREAPTLRSETHEILPFSDCNDWWKHLNWRHKISTKWIAYVIVCLGNVAKEKTKCRSHHRTFCPWQTASRHSSKHQRSVPACLFLSYQEVWPFCFHPPHRGNKFNANEFKRTKTILELSGWLGSLPVANPAKRSAW